ncbi:hypothetical protein Psyaliredsea_20660 [Psychrobacter alimentarius]
MELVGQVSTVAFDKTGTLTEGKPRVTDVIGFKTVDGNAEGHDTLLALFASVDATSSHPLAIAIVDHAKAANVVIPESSNAFATAGKAVHATVAGRSLAIGSPVYVAENVMLLDEQQTQIETLQNEGKTVSVLFDDQTRSVLGLVALRDELREDAQQAIAQLQKMNVRSVMLTGDNSRTAKALASQLDIEWKAELLPEDKLRLLSEMQASGKIAMIGDGINDAPALATADVGIAMGSGTDVAIETADIALLKNRVVDMANLIALSRATMRNIHQNVVFALGLKGVFLITTVFGITGLWIAVLADTGATVLVTLNALRLLRFKTGSSN